MSLFIYRSKRFNRFYGVTLFLYSVWFLVGLFVVGASIQTPFGEWADFIFITLAALVLLLHFATQVHGRSVFSVFLLFVLVSGLMETIGALTGVPFGSYTYTDQFGPMLFGVLPAAIPLAWWVIVWPIHCLVKSALAGTGVVLWIPVLTGIGAVLADLIIEPAATLVRGYWGWEGGGIYYGVPWTNFLAWFGTAFLLSLMTQLFFPHTPLKKVQLRTPVWVLGTTIITFVLVSVVTGKWWVLIPAGLFFYGIRWLYRSSRTDSLSQ